MLSWFSLFHHKTRREDTVTRQDATSGKESSILPVRQAQLGSVQRVLAINPAGKTISEKW
jgi:hypothetical protein